jgi:hypothetical protein
LISKLHEYIRINNPEQEHVETKMIKMTLTEAGKKPMLDKKVVAVKKQGIRI